jgi:hypothetical protein
MALRISGRPFLILTTSSRIAAKLAPQGFWLSSCSEDPEKPGLTCYLMSMVTLVGSLRQCVRPVVALPLPRLACL